MRHTSSTQLLTLIASVVALSLGNRFFVPLTLSLILSAVLYPMVASLRRVHVPVPLGAAVAVLAAVVVLVGTLVLIGAPARAFVSDVPKTLMTARARLAAFGVRLPAADATDAPSAQRASARPGATRDSGVTAARPSGTLGASGSSAS